MHKRSLFWHVFPTFVLLTVGLLLLLLLESKGRLRDFYIEQTATDLAASAAMFAESAKVPLEKAEYGEVDALAKRLSKASGLRITVVLPKGKVVAESEEDPALLDSHRTRPEIAAALDSRAAAHDVRFSNTFQKDFLYVALPLMRDGKVWAVVRLSMPATAVDAALIAFERRILYGALAATVLIVVASWLVARRISRPLEALTQGAERFGRGELHHRLPSGGSREIVALSETLNEMAGQLREQIQTAAVQRSELEAVFLSMEEGVLVLDNQGRILTINRAAGQMFSLDTEKVRGRPMHEVLRKANVLRFTEDALSGSLPLQSDIVIYDRDRRFLTAYGSELRNAQGERIGVLVVFREVMKR